MALQKSGLLQEDWNFQQGDNGTMYQQNHKSKFTTNDVKNWQKLGKLETEKNLDFSKLIGTLIDYEVAPGHADNKSDKNNDNADETGTETLTVKKTWNFYFIITHF